MECLGSAAELGMFKPSVSGPCYRLMSPPGSAAGGCGAGTPALDWSDMVDDLNDHGVRPTPVANTYAAAM
ncbi:hypothetical protein ACFV30_33860 [Streptomyces sp. NPDC059752]|uniref:hypothetical protein n=1 Tax=unclassified Streptomyces TaxID=2593676 RepID=UPI00366A45C2